MSKSNYLENAILDHQLGGPDYVRPGTVYIALYTTSPTDSGGGVEVVNSGYTRVPLTNNTTNFPPAVNGSKSNGVAITFPMPSGSWGVVRAFGIFDASTGGNLLRWGALGTAKTIDAGDNVSFPAGSLVLTED